MVRGLRPTDVVAYLAFRNQVPQNEALIRADGACSVPTITGFLGRALALAPRRESWVSIEGGQMEGLVAAKARFGTDVWDVEQLMAARFARSERVCLRLLEHLSRAGVEDGIQRIFLRLREESDVLAVARQAGFLRYTTELIYRHPDVASIAKSVPKTANVDMRQRRPVDHQALFQLYSAVVPAYVRQMEGLTLQEWRWTDGWGVQPMRLHPGARRRDFVTPSTGPVSVWVQVSTSARVFTLLAESKAGCPTSGAIDFCLAALGAPGPVTFTVREYQGVLTQLLEERGFELVARHALLARTLAIRVPDRKLVPIQVS